ncbi:phosphate ABC transporter permease PstA [Aneurinibacillus tyrosinisolvens]|uniref:phosphate ABC transporter permease PstA n=1 Tax=Aneurinibacillus tyrosinisolvens TaxID=1443435 RepID=UPI00063F130F|nr:phosphate ABC transporter permease PstA [Aneurinibacillus tyrosinisolvens]
MKAQITKRKRILDKTATVALWILAAGVILLIAWLLFHILSRGITKINLSFLLKVPDEIETGGGIGPVLLNSFYVLILSMVFSLPVGIGAGIYLAEYARDNKVTGAIRMCVESLASVPSIVFGLFGMAIFVNYLQIGLTVIGASLTLALLNLPILTRVTEESIRAVPNALREAYTAMGATKSQCIRKVVLPTAFSRIITGISLVAGRAYGESAVIILTAGTSTSGMMWDFNLFSPGETLAVHLWYVQSEAIVPDAKEIADKAAAVLVFVVLMINFLLRLPVWFMERKFKI